jgi:hypothetical protein
MSVATGTITGQTVEGAQILTMGGLFGKRPASHPSAVPPAQ